MVVVDIIDKPYNTSVISENKFIREFSKDVDQESLVWHRDKKDRLVKIIEGKDWSIQFDNFMPENLSVGSEFYIPKNTYHRIIKGTTDLKIEITEF
jgi:hypothetical protein